MRTVMRFLAWSALAAALSAGAAQAGGFSCRETPIVQTSATLGPLSARIAQGRPLTILAIGSSSTEGVGASARDRTYPARLQALLAKAWPRSKVEIVNAGIGGETAPQTFARLKSALAERRYDLVIWQVGTNDAVRGGDLDSFKTLLHDGITMVLEAGPALTILDPQYFPSIRNPDRYAGYVAAIGEIARLEAVPVFSRYEAMTQWHRDDAEAFTAALSTDGFHMSDAGYDCLARDMANALVGMAAPVRPVVAQSR